MLENESRWHVACHEIMLVSMERARTWLAVARVGEGLVWGLARFGRSGARVTKDAAGRKGGQRLDPRNRKMGPDLIGWNAGCPTH